MGIFSLKMNKEGAVCGMIAGMSLMLVYMLKFKFGWFGGGNSSQWWFGISPEGIGTLGMIFSFFVAFFVSRFTSPPPLEIQDLVDDIRVPVNSFEKVNET